MAIQHEIEVTQDIENYKLTDTNKTFLVDTLTEQVRAAINKYIIGSAEHGDDFLTEVDHLREATKEVTDLIFYLNAAIRKYSIYDKRNNTSS